MTLQCYQPGAEVKLSWSKVEKRLRQLVQEGSYLSPEELAQTMPEPEAPPPAPEPPAPTQTPLREITQADIDAALQEWNGDMDSKRRVQQYMTDHSREKGAAEWLRNEYGDGLPAFPVTAEGAATDLPWPKVQRHLARLVKEDRFLLGEERGEAAVEEPEKDVPAQPTVREIFDQYKPVVAGLVLADVAYQNACRNSDKETAIIEGDAAVKRAALTITEPDFMRLYFDLLDSATACNGRSLTKPMTLSLRPVRPYRSMMKKRRPGVLRLATIPLGAGSRRARNLRRVSTRSALPVTAVSWCGIRTHTTSFPPKP